MLFSSNNKTKQKKSYINYDSFLFTKKNQNKEKWEILYLT